MSGCTPSQVENHGITILYHQHRCGRVQCEIFRTYIGEGGINGVLSIEENLLLTVMCIKEMKLTYKM